MSGRRPGPCLTDGRAMLAPLKVAHDYKPEALVRKEGGDDVAMEKVLQGHRKRARARNEGPNGDGDENEDGAAQGTRWRPPKRHRMASAEVLLDLEYMMRVRIFDEMGLRDICIDKDPAKAPSAFEWPSATTTRDNGPDMMGSLAYLTRELHANVDEISDLSHNGWRSLIAALREVSLWSFMTVMMSTWDVLTRG